MPRWPLHEDVEEALRSLEPTVEELPPRIHEQERAHVIEWRSEHFPGDPRPETITDRLEDAEEDLGEVLIRAETFEWGRCWVVHAAEEDDDA